LTQSSNSQAIDGQEALPPATEERRRWPPRKGTLLTVVVAIILVPLSVVFSLLTGQALGIPLFVVLLILVGVHNFRVSWIWGSFTRRAKRNGASPWRGLLGTIGTLSTGLLWAPMFLLQFAGAAPLFFTTGMVAVVLSILQFREPGKGVSRYFLPVYNVLATIYALAIWVAVSNTDPLGGAGFVLHTFSRSAGLFQELEISLFAVFVPVFALPPILPEPRIGGWLLPRVHSIASDKPEPPPSRLRRWKRRGVWLMNALLALFVISSTLFQVALLPLSASSIASFDELPSAASEPYGHHPGFHFAITGAAFTDTATPPSGWRSVVQREISLASELNVSYLRYDIQEELLQNPQGLADLNQSIAMIRSAGLGIILSPFGYQSWGSHHPTVDDLNSTIQNESLFLAENFHPSYLFPFYEPNGQVQVNLGYSLPTSEWLGMIAVTAAKVKTVAPETKVLIEIADNSQGMSIAQGLVNMPDVDAVGFDLYPGSVSDMSHVDSYATLMASHPQEEFWISEIGMDSTQFGTDAQARFIAKAVSEASTNWNASGVCVWGLEDNVGLGLSSLRLDGLGIVTESGSPKPAFYAYQTAIAAVS
jgi:hypothetical protein